MDSLALRLFVVLCIVVGVFAITQALYYRQRAEELEVELVVAGSLIAESRFRVNQASALMQQYEQRCPEVGIE